jgi:hypothetical protein
MEHIRTLPLSPPKVRAQRRIGIKPGLGVTADQVLQKIEQWRDELNVALAMWGRGRGSDAEGS